MFQWFLPTFWGDIRLEAQGEDETRMVIQGLTEEEKVAVKALLLRAEGTALKNKWASEKAIQSLDLGSMKEQSLDLMAPIVDVQKVLAKALRPTRKKLSVVKFSGGKMEEATEATLGLITTKTAERSPSAGATLALPTIGCPEPDFPDADLRATRVLRTFLSDDQLKDFERHNAFLAIGADTGHRYRITSRHSRTGLSVHVRSLYDLDEGRPLCVHDWDVPAAEEMLTLLACVSLPGRESYVRVLE